MSESEGPVQRFTLDPDPLTQGETFVITFEFDGILQSVNQVDVDITFSLDDGTTWTDTITIEWDSSIPNNTTGKSEAIYAPTNATSGTFENSSSVDKVVVVNAP